ncbi:hypothetical protein, partial [Pseudonocardia phyllosphaerae]|uniref:hypothetical protein n=1 Tax=Pseudonocardia phyllosphaerae TaxID=3390502 RepID=UPI00397CB82E
MPSDRLRDAYRLLVEAVDALDAAAGADADDADLLSSLPMAEGVVRRLDRCTVAVTAELERRGAFVERGYKNADS